ILRPHRCLHPEYYTHHGHVAHGPMPAIPRCADLTHTEWHCRPCPSVEFKNGVGGGVPDFPFSGYQQFNSGSSWHCSALLEGLRPWVPDAEAKAATQPDRFILRGSQKRQIIADAPVRFRFKERLQALPGEPVDAKARGRTRREGLNEELARLELSQNRPHLAASKWAKGREQPRQRIKNQYSARPTDKNPPVGT